MKRCRHFSIGQLLCKYNTLFVVKVSYSMSDYQKRGINIFIDKLLTYKNEEFIKNNEGKEVEKSNTSEYMDSCLVFIYNKDSESFLNELKNLKPCKRLIIQLGEL